MFASEFSDLTFPNSTAFSDSYIDRLPGEDFLTLDNPLLTTAPGSVHHPVYAATRLAHDDSYPSHNLYSFGSVAHEALMHTTNDPYAFRRMSADTQASDASGPLPSPAQNPGSLASLPPVFSLAAGPESSRPESSAGSADSPSLPTWSNNSNNNQATSLANFQFPAAVVDPIDPQLHHHHHHHHQHQHQHHHQQRYSPLSAGGGGGSSNGAYPASTNPFVPLGPPARLSTAHVRTAPGYISTPASAHPPRPDETYEQLMLAPGDMPSYNQSRQPGIQTPTIQQSAQSIQNGTHLMPPLAAQQRRRGKLPKPVTEFLKKWLLAHTEHPYPTEDEKKWLCSETGLSMSQVSNWMINARRRILAPAAKANAAAAAAAANAAPYYPRNPAMRGVSNGSSVSGDSASLPVYLPNAYNVSAPPPQGRRDSYPSAGYVPGGVSRQVPPLTTQYNMLPSPPGYTPTGNSAASSSSYNNYFPPSATSQTNGQYPPVSTTSATSAASFNGNQDAPQGSPHGTPPTSEYSTSFPPQ